MNAVCYCYCYYFSLPLSLFRFHAPFFSRYRAIRLFGRWLELSFISSSIFTILKVSLFPSENLIRQIFSNRGMWIIQEVKISWRQFFTIFLVVTRQGNTKDKLALSRYAVVNFYQLLSWIGVIRLHLSLWLDSFLWSFASCSSFSSILTIRPSRIRYSE